MVNSPHNLGMGADDLVAGAVELASPPEIYLRLTELLDDPAHTALGLADVLEKDPGMSARLLRLVNSAFYGFPSQIDSVRRAVTIVGMRELRDLVLATAVLDMFSGLPNELVNMQTFWENSLRCAVVAKLVAEAQESQQQVESLFVCGLLHEIGHLVMYSKLPELAREAWLRHRYGAVELHKAEQQVFGFDYAAVGGALMRGWRMPLVLQETVEFHLEPERARDYGPQVNWVRLARRVASAGTFDPRVAAQVVPGDDPGWRQAGIAGEDAMADLLVRAADQYQAALALVQ
ncbi:MAG: HDOD domain-containing protein [Gammaproteobacteria bacterium]